MSNLTAGARKILIFFKKSRAVFRRTRKLKQFEKVSCCAAKTRFHSKKKISRTVVHEPDFPRAVLPKPVSLVLLIAKRKKTKSHVLSLQCVHEMRGCREKSRTVCVKLTFSDENFELGGAESTGVFVFTPHSTGHIAVSYTHLTLPTKA